MLKPKHQENWKEQDAYLLMKCAGKITKEKIAEILNCTVDRVIHKARAQGISLKKPKEST